MTPLYDGQENHYKKMLDLQEKLRKSEEERIRLEERFNLLVQESRNRHQACINKLRMRYVEFLEEQRARDERNNKLLGALNKVDNSLAMMSAKTERLNTLRRQYEAYLLRTYGNQRGGGSVTADSGLESQNDREITPSPILAKSIPMTPKPSNPAVITNQDSPASRYKAYEEDLQKLSVLQKQLESQETPSPPKYSPAVASSSPYDDSTEAFKNRYILPNLPNFESWKYSSVPSTEPGKDKNSFPSLTPRVASVTSSPVNRDLDRYLSKIKRQLHTEYPEPIESEQVNEQSLEEADHEQNTSGDLLNVSLSDDGLEASTPSPVAEEDTKKQKTRLRSARQAYASQSTSRIALRNKPIELIQRNVRAPVSEKRDELDSEVKVDEHTHLGLKKSVDKFSKQETATQREIAFKHQEDEQEPFEAALAKLANLDETRRLIQQNRDLIAQSDDKAVTDETRNLSETEIDEASDRDSVKGDGEGCIEDDYDDTVDIDSWMPDDMEERLEDLHMQDEIRERPRRKLESIEEVEQTEDEEATEEEKETKSENEAEPTPDIKNESKQIAETENLHDVPREETEEQVENTEAGYDANQQYYDQEKQQYEPSAEYQNYDQQPQGDQQYDYSNDPNQQYAYEQNAQYAGYDNQQYMDGNYEGYYEQYDPNQAYEYDPNQEYQQYATSAEYEGYADDQQQQGLGVEQPDNAAYGEGDQSQEYLQQANFTEETNVEHLSEEQGEQFADTGYQDQANDVVAKPPAESDLGGQSSKDDKRKKDKIKSILDSDSESFIERNLSNTESDFDFN